MFMTIAILPAYRPSHYATNSHCYRDRYLGEDK